MKVQFLYFPDCPNHEAAREALGRCLAALKLPPDFDDIDVTGPEVPEVLRSWGSPTILVNGVDVSGQTAQQSGSSCRIYGASGVPTDEQITKLLNDQALQ